MTNQLEFSVTNSPQYRGESIVELKCGKAKLAFTTRWKPKVSDLEEVARAFRSQMEEPTEEKPVLPVLEEIHMDLIHQLIVDGPYDKEIIEELAADNAADIVGDGGNPDNALEMLTSALEHCITHGYVSEVVMDGEKGSYAVTALGFDMYTAVLDDSDVEDMMQ